MSWMKRGQPGEGAGAGPQPYGAPQVQPFANQPNMYTNYPAGTENVPQQPGQQGQYWQGAPSSQPQHQYSQQYGAVYQQEFPPNANQMYQQPQYNHNYTNTGYANPQQGFQQNYYQNQPPQNYTQNRATNNDGWEDNWDWGWDESAKQAQRTQTSATQHAPHQEQVLNNANVLEESFAPTNTWNWATDDKKVSKEPVTLSPERVNDEPATLPPNTVQNNITSELNNSLGASNGAPLPADGVRTLSDRDVVKEHMPNLALGKRFHLDNLTPQWSIESQMSQESSDGPHTHSESTYRSENQSRNSGSNSPGPITDNSNFNYSQAGLEEGYTQNSKWSRQSDEPTLADSIRAGSRRESHEELAHTMQHLALVNHENVQEEHCSLQRSLAAAQPASTPSPALPPPGAVTHPPPPTMMMPPPSPALPPDAAATHPPPPTMTMPPPPPVSAAAPSPPAASPARPPSAGSSAPTPPAPSQLPVLPPSNAPHPPPPTVASLPPPNFPPPSNSQNPFKHAGPFGHKPKPSSSGAPGPGQFPPPVSGTNLASPAAVKAASGRPPVPLGFEANLESAPDNSERPDAPAAAWGAPPAAPHVPDNMEVAPRSDRNEYLQTAHLSADYSENAEFARDAPPPGPRRMGVGRHEPAPADEPPPGLARMVPGRQTDGDGACDRPADSYRGAYRRADGGRTPEYGGERRPLARATPAGEPAPAPEYAAYARPALPGVERVPLAASDRDRDLEGSDNLQDLSAVGSTERTYSREDPPLEPRSAEPEPAAEGARRSSADTDRERAYDASSPRRDARYKHERDDRKPREERRSGRDRRDRDRDRRARDARDARDDSPDARRTRRSARSHRYETEDTDYYSDKERDRRRYREGSHASRPPRHGAGAGAGAADGRERRRDRDRDERSYRDIDPARKLGNRRRERDDGERRRVRFSRDAKPSDSSRSEGETYSPARGDSRTATDEEGERRRDRPRHSSRRLLDPYYDGYGSPSGAYGDPYLAQRAQYSYYERLRAADPAAYTQLYRRLMAARQEPRHDTVQEYLRSYGLREERASVHSGRSSAADHKGADTYYAFRHDSLRDAPSLRTDLSDRDITDMSLPPCADTSTVRSDRMTPHRFSTPHVKGSISCRDVVVVRGSWPADGLPATVQVVSLAHALLRDPAAAELQACPGPLVRGVTHKKSVIEYCMVRVRNAAREGARDARGYGLIWELLALLLTQNGVVVGSDIAELLMKNTREHEHQTNTHKTTRSESRRESSVSGSAEEARSSPDLTEPSANAHAGGEPSPAGGDEGAALDKLREHLLCGNRQEALEWAMSSNLWGHALHLAAYSDRRTRTSVAARFLAATPRADPIHTLYATLAGTLPPAATCVSEERWADWRPHAAVILANAGARPDHDTRTLTHLGDSLASRGLIYSAQFCYVVGGVRFARHPLAPLGAAGAGAGAAPPRLSLLLAEPRARTLAALATTRAILATEIYEYALSLNQDYVIPDLQVYKFVLSCRLVDCGQYERALAYVEQAARAVTRAPADYAPRLVRNLAEMADRLKYHDPALLEDPPLLEEGSSEGSPRHQQWMHDVQTVAHMMQAESQVQHTTPQHVAGDYYGQQQQQQYWDQAQYQQQQASQALPPAAAAPAPYVEPEVPPEYSHQYYPPPPAPAAPAAAPPAPPAAPGDAPDVTSPQYAYEDWSRTEEHHAQQYADPGNYWHQDNTYTPYGEASGEIGAPGAAGEESSPRPVITMPGSRAPAHGYGDADDDAPDTQQQERETDTPQSSRAADSRPREAGGKGGGWLGGILTKLSLRPPNQMILPDDKNPTIVWDAEKKRWKNLDGEEPEGEQPPPPPPAAQRLPHPSTSTPNASPGAPPAGGAGGAPPPPPVSNIFKMQKGRHIKKSYVDVFNPSGAASRPLPPAASVLGPAPALAPNPTYFVPAAATQNDMYEPSAAEHNQSGI